MKNLAKHSVAVHSCRHKKIQAMYLRQFSGDKVRELTDHENWCKIVFLLKKESVDSAQCADNGCYRRSYFMIFGSKG